MERKAAVLMICRLQGFDKILITGYERGGDKGIRNQTQNPGWWDAGAVH